MAVQHDATSEDASRGTSSNAPGEETALEDLILQARPFFRCTEILDLIVPKVSKVETGRFARTLMEATLDAFKACTIL
jgi:hypothetical protein